MKQILNRIASLLLAACASMALAGCSGLIYDDEGDCAPYYKVRFIYDTNLKFTDAFAAEVSEVTLYVTDPDTGEILWQRHESGEALASGGYMMDVDIEPGTYTLVAWCGEGHTSSFSVASAAQASNLSCRLEDRETPADGSAGSHVRSQLGRLYHGIAENVVFEEGQGVHVKNVRLIKDTNDLHIVLQHLSGSDVNHEDFTFTVGAENGLMDWRNNLCPDEPLTYFAHTAYSGTAGVEVPDYTGGMLRPSRGLTSVSAAVAHLSLSRLTEDSDTKVEIFNSDGEKIVSIPLVDYALLVRGHYRHPDGSLLTPQEYLDYQDDYSMVFFLDENGRWVNSHIYINSWRVVLQNTEL